MLNHEITSKVSRHRRRRRVGRGTGSGQGKTCGRGHKGAGSRAGSVSASVYEGGQMPLFRRLPKRGFNNRKFATRCEIVNICQLERFEDGSSISIEQLSDAGLVDSVKSRVKILGKGDLTRRLQVSAHKFSKSAEEKITASGGTAKLI
ncbi:MAG: 50S ribosomal protein L15 [Phycisphaerales bacterium]|nr:MAG: 50S ribosomal protein L15 [Phycisphaerales bacterium]UCF15417.1 MAG: 50S ribosomal protein L15 [Phycisphaerales bacterium]